MNLHETRIFIALCILGSAGANTESSTFEVSSKATLTSLGQKLMRAHPHPHEVNYSSASSLIEADRSKKPLAGGVFKKYHTSEEIFSLIEKSKEKCNVPLTTKWMKDSEGKGQLYVARLGNPEAKKKVLIAANEHARELLTAEVVLRLIQSSCGQHTSVLDEVGDDEDEDADSSIMQQKEYSMVDATTLLKSVQFTFVPIVNVKGRQRVETNENSCQRTTVGSEGDVDLNRNMEVDWGKGSPQRWGPKPFSTYQARILRDLAAEGQYLAYIDLHTGARSLMTSWGFKPMTDPDFGDQKKVLDIIQAKHCPDCEIGSNRVVIGYENPGEIIDHMYATQKIKYSTLWELYAGNANQCLMQFNPPDHKYEKTVNNWSNALLTFGDYVHKQIHESERANPGDPASLHEVADGGLLVEQEAVPFFSGDTHDSMSDNFLTT